MLYCVPVSIFCCECCAVCTYTMSGRSQRLRLCRTQKNEIVFEEKKVKHSLGINLNGSIVCYSHRLICIRTYHSFSWIFFSHIQNDRCRIIPDRTANILNQINYVLNNYKTGREGMVTHKSQTIIAQHFLLQLLWITLDGWESQRTICIHIALTDTIKRLMPLSHQFNFIIFYAIQTLLAIALIV